MTPKWEMDNMITHRAQYNIIDEKWINNTQCTDVPILPIQDAVLQICHKKSYVKI